MEINKNQTQSSARLLVSAFLSSDSFIPLEIGFSLQLTTIDNNFNQNYGEKHKNWNPKKMANNFIVFPFIPFSAIEE